jgi:hypothetical protein
MVRGLSSLRSLEDCDGTELVKKLLMISLAARRIHNAVGRRGMPRREP